MTPQDVAKIMGNNRKTVYRYCRDEVISAWTYKQIGNGPLPRYHFIREKFMSWYNNDRQLPYVDPRLNRRAA